jgi:hypothetical protein
MDSLLDETTKNAPLRAVVDGIRVLISQANDEWSEELIAELDRLEFGEPSVEQPESV